MARNDDKTEKPTPQRLKKARKDGQTWRSPEIGSWLGLLAGTFLLPGVLHRAHADVADLLGRVAAVAADPQPRLAQQALGAGLRDVVSAVLPLALVVPLVALVTGVAQGGLRLAAKPVKPTFSRINPFKGLTRVFGKQGAFEAGKAVLKATVISLFAFSAVSGLAHALIGSQDLPLPVALTAASGTALGLARSCAAVGVAVGLLDMVHRRRTLTKSLMMTVAEVKREQRMAEGDPHLKGAVRSRQLALSRNRMIHEVANADVVIVNPVHVAVALRYRPGSGAPRVVAAGRGAIAARIREVAQEQRVPVVVDIPLARTLHRVCELGTEIPPELFTAVARVLAFVMSLRRKGSAAGIHRPAPSTNLPGPELGRIPRQRQRRRRSAPQAVGATTPAAAGGA